MKKYDIAAIGELNVDIILNGIESEPEIGKEKFCKDMIVTLGSSTAIFAANAAALGSKVCFVGLVGKDSFGQLVRTSLEAKGVATHFIGEGDTPTGATICMSYGEDRANLTYQGSIDVMGFDQIDKSVFALSKHIHLSSLFMQSALLRDIHKVLDAAAENGCTVSLDTQWDPMEKWALDYPKVLPKITVFMPNEKELCALTGKAGLEDAIAEVLPCLGGIMLVKCGSKGSLLVFPQAPPRLPEQACGRRHRRRRQLQFRLCERLCEGPVPGRMPEDRQPHRRGEHHRRRRHRCLHLPGGRTQDLQGTFRTGNRTVKYEKTILYPFPGSPGAVLCKTRHRRRLPGRPGGQGPGRGGHHHPGRRPHPAQRMLCE